jgi:hypothetical protein
MIIFIVGVYKGGTSWATELVEEMGYNSVVDRVATQQGNSRVYDIRESYEVNCLNNEIINEICGNDDPSNVFYCNWEQAMKHELSEPLRNKISDFCLSRNNAFVVKDPRFIFTLRFWQDEVKNYRTIFVRRPSEEIAKSLEKDEWSVSKLKQGALETAKLLNYSLSWRIALNNKEGCRLQYKWNKYNYKVKRIIYNYLKGEERRFYPTSIYFLEYYKQGKELQDEYARYTPNNRGVWNELFSVDSQEDADYLILQDKTQESISDIKKIMFFGREPQHVYLHEAPETVNYRYHHHYGNCHLPAIWWLDYTYDQLKDLEPPVKTKDFSLIDSGKVYLSGHLNRVNFIKQLRNEISVDCYGRAHKELPGRDKSGGLLPYRYSLAIENGVTDHYFSEKITDCFLMWTIPFYYGCKKLENYFPADSFIRIDIDKPEEAIDIIKQELSSNNYKNRLSAIAEARELVLDRYSLWATIANHV